MVDQNHNDRRNCEEFEFILGVLKLQKSRQTVWLKNILYKNALYFILGFRV